MTVLVILPTETELSSISDKLVSCAQKFGESITLLIHESANQPNYIDALSKLNLVTEVISLDYAQEPMALSQVLTQIIQKNQYSTLLSSDGNLFQATLPRVAAKLGVGQVSNVTSVVSNKCFKHPIYAGNVIETVEVVDPIVVATVRCSAFDLAQRSASNSLTQQQYPKPDSHESIRIIEHIFSEQDSLDINSAKWVIGIGRGAADSEVYRRITEFADKKGFALGGTRAVVDSGLMPNDKQIGQTGKVIAPDIYLAIGISGAIQHLAGISAAKTIFAVNCDADAPIMSIADYAFVGNADEILPELQAAMA
ncbi:electron transfer flavoprotein subunit alpha/FixB family protein [Vibrio sp.]|nr:electron transfer flavoprotein subunit alpha/FixB family protein [Vibrio sp.]